MLAYLIVALYALLPITLLSSHSLPSGVFYVLLASSVAVIISKRAINAATQTYRYRWLLISYCVTFIAVAVSSVYHGDWAGANSEGALRFFLGIWVLLIALPHVDTHQLRHTIAGVYLAGLISTATLLWLIINVESRPLTPGVILTTYTSIMLLLGTVSVYSLQWKLSPWPIAETCLKVVVTVATFSGFIIAQTRTGLLGLPAFLLIGLILFIGSKKPIRLLIYFAISAALLSVAVANNDALRNRITQGIEQVKACHGENSTSDTSMCIRLQLWRAAIDAGTNHPWVGLGDGGKFIEHMKGVAVPKGLVSQSVVDDYFGEPHNDLMLMLAGFGLPGVLGLLLIYITPCAYLFPRLLNEENSPQARAAAAMGLAVCLGFFFFGLTETMFRRMNTIGFYTAMVALFMVLSEPKPSQRDRLPPPVQL